MPKIYKEQFQNINKEKDWNVYRQYATDTTKFMAFPK